MARARRASTIWPTSRKFSPASVVRACVRDHSNGGFVHMTNLGGEVASRLTVAAVVNAHLLSALPTAAYAYVKSHLVLGHTSTLYALSIPPFVLDVFRRDRSVLVRRRFADCIARWIEYMDGADLYEQEVGQHPALWLEVEGDAPPRWEWRKMVLCGCLMGASNGVLLDCTSSS